jgi:hypothetical protein
VRDKGEKLLKQRCAVEGCLDGQRKLLEAHTRYSTSRHSTVYSTSRYSISHHRTSQQCGAFFITEQCGAAVGLRDCLGLPSSLPPNTSYSPLLLSFFCCLLPSLPFSSHPFTSHPIRSHAIPSLKLSKALLTILDRRISG